MSAQEKFEELKNLYRQKYGEDPVGEITVEKIEKYLVLMEEVDKREGKRRKREERKGDKGVKKIKLEYQYIEPETEEERRRQEAQVSEAYDIIFNKVKQLRDEAHQRGEKWGLFE